MKIKTSALGLASLAVVALGTTTYGQILWNGSGDGVNWSDGDNWVGGVAPGTEDTARFGDAGPATVSSTVDAATTIQFLNLQQADTTGTTEISLGANLVINSNGTTGSGLTYASTISNPAMIVWNLNGNNLSLTSNSSVAKEANVYGTVNMNAADSFVGTTRFSGTGTTDSHTINLGSGANVAQVNVTANGRIGNFNTGSTAARAARGQTVNIENGSNVDVSNGSRLDFIRRTRITSNNNQALTVNNAGSIDVAEDSTVGVVYTQVNQPDRTVDITFNNQATGELNLDGTLAMSLTERGTASINNAGTVNLGENALITGTVTGAGAGDGGTVVMTNQAGGVLTGAVADTSLDYNPLTSATFLNQVLTVTNEGTISPGVGTSGAGLASVGELTLTDIDVVFSGAVATLAIDLAGTVSGLYDVLTLTNGALTLDADSKLEVYFVNGFEAEELDTWTILNYDSVTTTGFDLGSSLSIFGATGLAADVNNWSITFGPGSALLTLVPEPNSTALLGLGLCGLLIARRRR